MQVIDFQNVAPVLEILRGFKFSISNDPLEFDCAFLVLQHSANSLPYPLAHLVYVLRLTAFGLPLLNDIVDHTVVHANGRLSVDLHLEPWFGLACAIGERLSGYHQAKQDPRFGKQRADPAA
jgi:hypothetical protein